MRYGRAAAIRSCISDFDRHNRADGKQYMKKIFVFIKKNTFLSGLIISCIGILIFLIQSNGPGFLFEKISSYWESESSYIVQNYTHYDQDDAGQEAAAHADNDADGASEEDNASHEPDKQTAKDEGKSDTVSGNSAKPDSDDETSEKDDSDRSAVAESSETEGKAGVTKFTTYPPTQVSSKYYSDPGKIALTTEFDYQTITDDSYFDDAAFIGDSRMLGLNDYSGWSGADFFCDNGFCTYDWQNGKEVTFQRTHKKMTVEDAMSLKHYTKIYLMIGMNDCGYGTTQDFKTRLSGMVSMIEEKQPDAIIYLLANLHVSQAKAQGAPIFNNVDINDKNVAIGECADGIRTFYLDYNGLYTDEKGLLKQELTFDGAHLYAKNYKPWLDYIKSHVVKK